MLFFELEGDYAVSAKTSYTISCPQCSQEQAVELFDSVNLEDTPEARDLLMTNKLNRVECAACGFAFRVDKPLLYHDPGRRQLIYWIPAGMGDAAAGQRAFESALRELRAALPEGVEPPAVNLVFARVELVERIYLLDAGLDPRIIEYIKYLIFSNNNLKVSPAGKNLLFNAEDSTPENLCFVIQDAPTGRFESVLMYRREAYQALCELFAQEEQRAKLVEMFPGPYLSARMVILAAGENRDN